MPMNNEERWTLFIDELTQYIEQHHHGPSKHSVLYNAQKYYRKRLKQGRLHQDKAIQLEKILASRK